MSPRGRHFAEREAAHSTEAKLPNWFSRLHPIDAIHPQVLHCHPSPALISGIHSFPHVSKARRAPSGRPAFLLVLGLLSFQQPLLPSNVQRWFPSGPRKTLGECLSSGCHNQIPQTVVCTMEVYLLTVPEARSLRSRHQPMWDLVRAPFLQPTFSCVLTGERQLWRLLLLRASPCKIRAPPTEPH